MIIPCCGGFNMTTSTLKDKVYSSVLLDIINGEYTVDSIISEKALAEKLQVSKAPVREALVALCSNGILQSVPRQGYTIVKYTDKNLHDILEYRIMLECGCLARSFDHITPTQLLRLDSIVRSEFIYLPAGDPRDYLGCTLNFHLTLASYAENEYVYNQLDDALNTSMRAYLQLYWKEWKEHAEIKPSSLHLQIVEAIRVKDKKGALELLKDDITTLLSTSNHQFS